MNSCPELLSPIEREQIREQSPGEVDHELRVRFLCEVGLEHLYAHDSIVYPCLRLWVAGQIKYRGALLLAHRALVNKYNRGREMLAKHGIKVPFDDILPQTIESVDVTHVICLAQIAEDILRMAMPRSIDTKPAKQPRKKPSD